MTSLAEWKPHDPDAAQDADSDISDEDAGITTALIGSGAALGQPEVKRRFWFSKSKYNDDGAVATQV